MKICKCPNGPQSIYKKRLSWYTENKIPWFHLALREYCKICKQPVILEITKEEALKSDELMIQGEAIDWWNRQEDKHPLTCPRGHTLRGLINDQDQIVLYCSQCKYTQEKIPPIVLEMFSKTKEFKEYNREE
jgi:ribosomal protein L44E